MGRDNGFRLKKILQINIMNDIMQMNENVVKY